MKFTGASITPALAAVLLLGSAPFVFAAIPPNCNTVVITCPLEALVTGAIGEAVQTTLAVQTFCTYPLTLGNLVCVYSNTTGVLNVESSGIGCPPTASSTACATCPPGFGLDASGACTACAGDTFSPSGGASACASCPIGFTPTVDHSTCQSDLAINCLTVTSACPPTDEQGFDFDAAASGVNGNTILCAYVDPENALSFEACPYIISTGLLTTGASAGNQCFPTANQQCMNCNAGFGLDSINNCVPCAANEVDASGGTTCTTCAAGLVPNTDQSACVLSASQAARRKTRRSAGFARKGLESSGEVQW